MVISLRCKFYNEYIYIYNYKYIYIFTLVKRFTAFRQFQSRQKSRTSERNSEAMMNEMEKNFIRDFKTYV